MTARWPVLLALTTASLCAGTADAASPFGAAVGDAALDRVRGGFTSPDSGLHVSFGVVQRTVYVNGDRATEPAAAGVALLVQRGDGNRVAGTMPGSAGAATVVQNTLDNQKLQVVTTISVQTDGLRVSRGAALQSAVGLGIAASLRR